MNNYGTLYIVATPIGNLKDITYRAVETLNNVDYIACEDTRHSIKLLNAYNIKKPLFSYYKEKEQQGSEKIIIDLKQGKNIALISDAGMPCISDPGSILINKLHKENISVKVIPGPSACVSAFALSGFLDKGFVFAGFLPNKNKDIELYFNDIDSKNLSIILYVAPHDLKSSLLNIKKYLGNRKIAIIKEISKIYESVDIKYINDINLSEDDTKYKGEYVVVIESNKEEKKENISPENLLKLYLNSGMDKKEAIKKVARELSLTKDVVYKICINKEY